METSGGEWAAFEKMWTKEIVASINRLRDIADLTVKGLAERLRLLGWPVSDATLSGMLSGGKRTSISIAELFAFARALNVSPLYLMLGLPAAAQLPDGKLWEDWNTDNYQLAQWVINSKIQHPFPGDDISRTSKTSARWAATIARHGLEDVANVGECLRIISWQAAQILAADAIGEEAKTVMPEAVYGQDYLWEAINRLSYSRNAQLKLDEGYGVAFADIPSLLAFVDKDPIEQREDFALAELRTLTSEQEISQAYENIKEALERRKLMDSGSRERTQTDFSGNG